jgi:hypothetical protein
VAPETVRIREFSDQAQGYLSEALFIVAGKLREAASALAEARP